MYSTCQMALRIAGLKRRVGRAVKRSRSATAMHGRMLRIYACFKMVAEKYLDLDHHTCLLSLATATHFRCICMAALQNQLPKARNPRGWAALIIGPASLLHG